MDYLDLDDLQDEYNALKDDLYEGNITSEETKRYHAIVDFVDECGIDPDDNFWNDRGPGIPKHMFSEYAEELAREINPAFWENQDSFGYGSNEPITNTWPLNCIDWEQAARELQYDYSLVTFDGEEYYVRAF